MQWYMTAFFADSGNVQHTEGCGCSVPKMLSVLAEGLLRTNVCYIMVKTQKPERSLLRMSRVGCILALLFMGVVLLLIYYFR